MNGFLIFTKIFRMRALKHIIFFGIFFIGFRGQSQVTVHPTVFAGYEYQNSNFGEVGARFIFLKNDNVLYRVSGSALMGKVNGEFAVLPKFQGDILLNFEKNVDIQHSYYLLAGAEITPQFVAPKAGISLFGIIDFTGGYAFQLGNSQLNDRVMEGLNLNFTVNIPLVVFSKSKKNK